MRYLQMLLKCCSTLCQASFGRLCGQTGVSLVRSADLLWTDVRFQAPHDGLQRVPRARPQGHGGGGDAIERTVEAGNFLIC